MGLQNQSNTNESLLEDESIDNTSTNGTDLESQHLATDVSGHYSNPSYGILDLSSLQDGMALRGSGLEIEV